MSEPEPYLGMPVGRFLDELAAGRPAPGGGSAAALTVALAAGLCAMAARLSEGRLARAAELAAQAEELRAGVAPLAQADADGYRAVLEAHRLPPGTPGRAEAISAALSGASAVPVQIVEAGVRVAGLAGRLAEEGNQNLRGDAETAALLAAAGARAAGGLVAINLAGARDDDRSAYVERLLRKLPPAAG
ncbi:MAG TPA: cyclodeaminase/cyclohydrolase family protein [Streptosporangiaceae bacterium]|nr:cyclodeaminase/cyclohydrolase family protein [Streptosporangiaceae bacterium]